ncbi:MAG: phosphoribosylformylglycinamidine cyclo-ligase [Bacillus sp. (in: firmicutes)]
MANAYKQAGVDIEAGYEAVNRMKKHVQKTVRPGTMAGLGGFGGMFDLSVTGLKEPVLVSGTDGVGTKLMLAFQMDRHDTIGIDCVAMCVNDIVVQGAEPLYFLDYIACGKADPEKIEHIVKGVAEGCRQAGAALIGGETAEMPGMYAEEEYDLAGFAVGACEKNSLVTGKDILEGDILIGLASNGIHSNGYSLVRKVLLQDAGKDLNGYEDVLGTTLGEELLKPTRIYVKPLLEALNQFSIKGLAHITGGGFIENIPRMLPEGLGVEIAKGTWPVQPIFRMIQEAGQISEDDMYNTFNMGIGMIAVIPEDEAQPLMDLWTGLGEKAYRIGKVNKHPGVSWRA